MKKLVLLSIIIIFFLSFSAIHAENNDTLSLVNEKTFDAVQTSIDNSTENIVQLEGTYYGEGNPITITKPVTIEGIGGGAKLDAQSSSQVFHIQSDNVVLRNLAIVNGVCDNPSGINYGGAVESHGNNLKIINCSFVKCSARYGGALFADGENVSIINSQFISNSAEYSGGAFELDGNNNHVFNCVFTDNIGYHAGGDVAWVGQNGILSDCQFTSIVDTAKSSQFGGAVVWMGANGQLSKSTFNEYYAKKYGSAIYWKGNNGSAMYNIFLDTDYAYWGNPDFADNNYWGLNINTTDEFEDKKLIYYNGSYLAPKIWVNLFFSENYIKFASNTGENLDEYLPNYKLNDAVEIINNMYIIKKGTMLLALNMVTYSLYDGKNLMIAIKDEDGNNLASKRLQIIINGNEYIRTTNSNGIVSFKISLKNPMAYVASIIFGGDETYNPISKNVSIVVKKQKATLAIKTKILKQKSKKKTIRFVLKNQFKKAISKATVKITINKKTYSAKTNSKGIASFKVKLKNKGKYNIKAKFKGNSYYNSISKKFTIKIR